MPSLVRSPDQHSTSSTRYPVFKLSTHPDFQVAGLQEHATTPGDRYVRLQPNYSLGSAIESDGVIDEAEETWPTENIRVVTTEHGETEAGSTSPQLPAHLTDLFDRSSKKLNETEKEALANLLIEFSDVFSTGDSDLGKFSVIKHKIDTGTARPIRQPMRRTPLGFEKEEEKHLKQMLGAEIIQPSTSEWASPPVLVRKKDGSVRWCIDYRALNNVRVKDVFQMVPECLANYYYIIQVCQHGLPQKSSQHDLHRARKRCGGIA